MRTRKIELLYFWVPLIILLFPPFPYLTNFGVQIISVILFSLLIVLHIIKIYSIRITGWCALYVTLILSITVNDIIIDTLFNRNTPQDYLEILRPILFLLLYQFYRYSNLEVSLVEKRTIQLIYFFYTIIGIYCLLEFIFPDIIRPISFTLWKRHDVPILTNKAIGSFFQTYNYGYALLLPYIYSFLRILNKNSIFNLIFFILILTNLLLTQSRSMYICAFLGTVFCFIIPNNYSTIKKSIRTISIIITLLIASYSIFILFQDYIEQNLGYAFNGLEAISQGQSSSVDTRNDQIKWAIENNNLIIVGGGIGKNNMLLESLYALYYYRYGLIGLTIFSILTWNLILYSFRNAYNKLSIEPILYNALGIFYALSPIALSSSCHHDQPKTSILFYGLAGMVFYRYSYNLKSQQQLSNQQ